MSFINIKKYKKRLIGYLKDRFATINETPIIVLGNQKSGTSAIAHLLADYGGLSRTIDIPPLWVPVVFKIMNDLRESHEESTPNKRPGSCENFQYHVRGTFIACSVNIRR